MPNTYNSKIIYRIIDANINRAKEGLRVCEEITRFILDSYNLTTEFKKIRHRADTILEYLPRNTELFKERRSLSDVGRKIYINELKRKNCRDIFFANIQRAKESVRVLEEFTKLINKNIAVKFKRLRYDIYELEKKAAKRISSLCYRR
ncbi:MAG: thiamine-phosphate pyrophosphorylase [Candidatus Omnitrophota bacterium]|nr:thiamine-phosphate pyrophosphorylase [Candidatus Omnitrophota bacterium]